jgi:hypothetical protein
LTKLLTNITEHTRKRNHKRYVIFIGFSNKANGKRLLKQHFTENKDYQKLLIRMDEQTLLIRSDEQKNKDSRGGL